MNRLRDILKTGDVVLIVVLVVSVILSFPFFRLFSVRGQLVSVSVNGREVDRFPLSENRNLSVQGPLGKTLIRVKDGKVWVAKAPCPQKICMKMGKISRSGEIIVCIPNRVFIKIEGNTEQNLDGITM